MVGWVGGGLAAVTRGVVGEGVVTGFREERTREWGDRRVVVGGGLAAVTGGFGGVGLWGGAATVF